MQPFSFQAHKGSHFVILLNSDHPVTLIISLHLLPLFGTPCRISRRAFAPRIPSAATFRGRKRTVSGTTGGRPCSSADTRTTAREYSTLGDPMIPGLKNEEHTFARMWIWRLWYLLIFCRINTNGNIGQFILILWIVHKMCHQYCVMIFFVSEDFTLSGSVKIG